MLLLKQKLFVFKSQAVFQTKKVEYASVLWHNNLMVLLSSIFE